MIDISLEKGPKNEKIRQKLMTPYSLVFSPGSLNKEIQTQNQQITQFPRCEKCHAYLSSFCQIDQQNFKWTCSICRYQNSFSQTNQEELPKLTSNDIQFVDRTGFSEEIIVIYISLSFQEQDFKTISSSISEFLKTSKIEKPILFLFGNNGSQFSILCPYQSFYHKDPNNSSISKEMNSESSDSNEFSQNPSPVFNLSLSQLRKEDISQFLFSPNQLSSAIRTIEEISCHTKETFSISDYMNNCDAIREMIFTPKSQIVNPIHFILIVPKIDDFISTKLLKKFYQSFCRIDILTAVYSKEVQDASQIIPGSISFLDVRNIPRTLSKLMRNPFLISNDQPKTEKTSFNQVISRYGKPGIGTIYEFTSNVRSNGATLSWRLSQSPSYDENCYAFSPVLPSIDQPFVLDIHPNGNTNEIYIQITVKMVMLVPKMPNIDTETDKDDSYYSTHYASVLRIFNRKFELSENIDEIAESLNVNTFLWLCMTRTIERSGRDVLAALYRTIAKIVNILIDKSEANNENSIIKKKYVDLIHGCCSLQFSDLMSDNEKLQMMAKYSLVLTPPSMFTLVPHYSEQNKFAIFGNTVYVDIYEEEKKQENADKAAKPKMINALAGVALADMPFMEKFVTPIPEWCKSPDQKTIDFLNTLMS